MPALVSSTTILTLLNAGKTLCVDSVNGNDGTAARGNAARPYATCTAAKAAAASGDIVHVRPGSYNEKNLLKNGVNWHFDAGAIVRYTGSVLGSIFDTSSYGTGSAVTSRITGHGKFELATSLIDNVDWQNNPYTTGEFCNVLLTVHTDDDIYIEGECGKYAANGGDGADFPDASEMGSVVRHGHGSVTCRLRSIFGNRGSGYWWTDGEAYVFADYIDGGYLGVDDSPAFGGAYAVWMVPSPPDTNISTGWTVGSLWLTASHVKSLALNGIIRMTLDPNTRAWLHIKEISSTSPANGSGPTVILDEGKLYLNAQKITGNATVGGIAVNGGSLWATIQKISDGNSNTSTITLAGGVSKIDLLQAEDLSGIASFIACSAGTHHVRILDAVSTATGGGVNVSGGTLRLVDSRINTSANSSGNPITKSGGTLILSGTCELIANAGRDSITAATAQDVKVYGAAVTNKAKNVNVTVRVGTLTVDGTYVA